jgi:phage terminase large subunit
MVTTQTLTPLERLTLTAWRVGCPQQQMEHFLSAGYVPQPKQLEFHAAARQADEPGGPDEIGFGGARGPGKSHAVLAQLALDDARRLPGFKGLYLRKVGKQAREQFDDLRRSVLRHVPNQYNRNEGVVKLWQDSRIFIGHFQHESDIDNYLGIEYDAIAVEECTALTLTKYRALRDSNRTSKPWRPRIYNTTNPGNVGHAWYKAKFINPAQAGKERATRFIFATLDDNRFIDPDYRRKLEENTGWRLRAYRFGDWDIAAGQFFTTWRHEAIVKPPPPFLPHHWTKWAALDYGFTHPTVVYLLAKDDDGNVYVVDEHRQAKWLVQQHAPVIKSMFGRHGVRPDNLVTFVAGHDAFAQKGQSEFTIAEQYAAEGLHLTRANVDRISRAAEVMRLLGDPANGVPSRLTIFDRCTHLIECLPAMEHDPNRPEDVLKVDVDEDGNGGDDPYDSFGMGVLATPGIGSYVWN